MSPDPPLFFVFFGVKARSHFDVNSIFCVVAIAVMNGFNIHS